MAQRRMFSLKIIGSDAFLDMPNSTRELYFQLGMYADDDGFINPRKIMRMISASEDDLNLLKAKRFIIAFKSGVVVIKHWLQNNYIRKDWYQQTQYIDEIKSLFINELGDYTDNSEGNEHYVNKMLTQDRIGKDIYNKKNKNFSKNTDAERLLKKKMEGEEDQRQSKMSARENIAYRKIQADIKKLALHKNFD